VADGRRAPTTADPPWPQPPEGRHDAGDPDEAFRVPFSVLDALVMVLWTVVAQVLVAGPALAVGLDPDEPLVLVLLAVAVQVATVAGVIGYLQIRGKLTWRLLGPVHPRWTHAAMGLGLGVAALVIVLTVGEVTNQVFGPFPEPEQALLQLGPSGAATTVVLVASTIGLAPLVEEVVFRGLLFQSVRRRLGLTAGMVVSALVFAYIHLELIRNPPAVVGLVALGLWLAGAFHRTGSLVVPVVAHATYNACVLVVVLVLG
jgi:membrane protease YdiL (CAAX protease family)